LVVTNTAAAQQMAGLPRTRVVGGEIGSDTVLQDGSSRVRYPIESFQFFIDLILPDAIGPLGRLSL